MCGFQCLQLPRVSVSPCSFISHYPIAGLPLGCAIRYQSPEVSPANFWAITKQRRLYLCCLGLSPHFFVLATTVTRVTAGPCLEFLFKDSWRPSRCSPVAGREHDKSSPRRNLEGRETKEPMASLPTLKRLEIRDAEKPLLRNVSEVFQMWAIPLSKTKRAWWTVLHNALGHVQRTMPSS